MTAKRRFTFLILSAISLFCFVILAVGVHNKMLDTLDISSMKEIQKIIPRKMDTFFSLFSIAGTFELSLLYISIIFIYIFFKEKKIFLGILLFFAIAFIELGGKIILFHPGPPFEFFRNPFVLKFPSGFIHTNYSFPSGHMGRVAFFAVLLSVLLGRWIKSKKKRYITWAILTVIFIIVFISRISLGEHWLSDVLGGSLLGISMGLLSFIFW